MVTISAQIVLATCQDHSNQHDDGHNLHDSCPCHSIFMQLLFKFVQVLWIVLYVVKNAILNVEFLRNPYQILPRLDPFKETLANLCEPRFSQRIPTKSI